MITLQPLDRSRPDLVEKITLHPDQIKFAGTVADALAEPADRFDLHQIRHATQAIGIFKIDKLYSQDYAFARVGDLGLRAVILDHCHQRQGFGTQAMRALSAYLPTYYPTADTLHLTVNLTNTTAIAVYIAAGFQDSGEIWPYGQAGPQKIMHLSLR
ncbi:MAG: GNAT family N-acetyltransferase [Pseudomonadota bacterium]